MGSDCRVCPNAGRLFAILHPQPEAARSRKVGPVPNILQRLVYRIRFESDEIIESREQ